MGGKDEPKGFPSDNDLGDRVTCSPGTRGQSADPVRVGVHLDSAKQASYYSLLQRDAIDRFITELNGSGGVLGTRLEVLYEDDETTR